MQPSETVSVIRTRRCGEVFGKDTESILRGVMRYAGRIVSGGVEQVKPCRPPVEGLARETRFRGAGVSLFGAHSTGIFEQKIELPVVGGLFHSGGALEEGGEV